MSQRSGSLKLFTPGPLSTTASVKRAMAVDMGSRSDAFSEITMRVCNLVERIADAPHLTAIPLQGSGTFAVEAMISSLIPVEGRKSLLVVNGDYGQRALEIYQRLGLNVVALNLDPLRPFPCDQIEEALTQDPKITDIYVVHFETGLGVRNPLEAVVTLAENRGIRVLVDAISTFGALRLPADSPAILAIAISANKCLHGAPGMSMILADRQALRDAETRPSLCFDLAAQHECLERSAQWRFTPPVQVVCAFDQALSEFFADGGQAGRLARYTHLTQRLIGALEACGVHPLVSQDARAPMITTFTLPSAAKVTAAELARTAARQGLEIYPGRHPGAECFRAGCMGDLAERDVDRLALLICRTVREGCTEP